MTVKIEVTKEAQVQVRELIKAQKPGTAVRVFLQAGGGGGCGSGCGSGGCGSEGGCGCGSGGGSHVTFGMAFDKARNGDEVVPIDGFSVVVDSMTASELDGAKIDFVQGLDQSGFQILPPMKASSEGAHGQEAAGGGCGCGSGGCC